MFYRHIIDGAWLLVNILYIGLYEHNEKNNTFTAQSQCLNVFHADKPTTVIPIEYLSISTRTVCGCIGSMQST